MEPCRKWEDIDHDIADSAAGALTGMRNNTEAENADPLGLQSRLE